MVNPMAARNQGMRQLASEGNKGKSPKSPTNVSIKDSFKQKGAEVLAERAFSKGKSSGKSQQASPSKISWGTLLIIGLLIIIVLPFLRPVVSDCFESGFCEEKIVIPLNKVLEPIKGTGGYIGKQIRESAAIIRGEQSFSWEGDTIENVKSGVWFESGKARGISELFEIGETGNIKTFSDEVNAEIDVMVGKMDQDIPYVGAKIECSLNGKGGSKEGHIRGYKKIGESKFFNITLSNPYPENERGYSKIGCVVYEDELGTNGTSRFNEILKPRNDQNKVFFSGNIAYNLTYGLDSYASLPVFVIGDENIYNDYIVDPESAFEDLAGGIYDEYSTGVTSSTVYDTDVEVVMRFLHQPLFKGDDPVFGIQFRNKNRDNFAELKEFKFKFPGNMVVTNNARIDDLGRPCEYFDFKQGSEWTYELGSKYLEEINKQLNREDGETKIYLCGVGLPEQDSRQELVNLGKVESLLSFENSISEEIRISN